MDIKGKVVVVTGAAQGIGKSLCQAFASAGARHVVATDLDLDKAKDVAREIGGSAYRVDVTDEKQVADLIGKVIEDFGHIDLYCSNAGVLISDPAPLDNTSSDNSDWQLSWDVNVMSHVYAARHLMPHMLSRAEGAFLVTASAAGLLSQIGSGPYSTTKHAAVGFAESLSIMYADQGIEVFALCPEAMDTELLRGASPAAASAATFDGTMTADAVAQSVLTGLKEGRFLILPHPQVARYVANKASDHDRWLSGMRKLRADLLHD